jgi:hypothetical protein
MATKEHAVRGSKHPHAVLNEAKVLVIRRRAARRGKEPVTKKNGGPRYDIPQVKLCAKYGISTQMMSRILTGKAWTHVAME